jgi:2-polyprenyl-3-methyl-5-hydroxy-6-metoxy-1,4-benzoquinol methylase
VSKKDKVKDFFENYARDFDTLYSDNKRDNFINRILRASFYRRFELAFRDVEKLKNGLTVLDVGTGTGRYLPLFAPKAQRIVGIDLSENMIKMAKARAEEEGYSGCLELKVGDFLRERFGNKFDLVTGFGYFDYTLDPSPHFRKMIKLSSGLVLASFPKRWHILTLQRKLRYMISRCPIRHYTVGEIMEYSNVDDRGCVEIVDIGREYYVRIRVIP